MKNPGSLTIDRFSSDTEDVDDWEEEENCGQNRRQIKLFIWDHIIIIIVITTMS